MRGTSAPRSRDDSSGAEGVPPGASTTQPCAQESKRESNLPEPPASSRYTLRVGSSLTDLGQAASAVDRAHLRVCELTAGIVLAEVINDLGFAYPEDGSPYRFATISESVRRCVGEAGQRSAQNAGAQNTGTQVAQPLTTNTRTTGAQNTTGPSTYTAAGAGDDAESPGSASAPDSAPDSAPASASELASASASECDDLPDFPAFSLDTNFSAWVHERVHSEHIPGVSAILGTSSTRSYRHLTQAMTIIHGLPRFAARVRAGEFTQAHVLTVADLCQTVAFRHLPRLDLHLATRRSTVTSDTLRTALRKLIQVLQKPEDRAEIASQRRRVDVETFGNGTACLSVFAPADEIHACYARVQAMARAIHAGQSNTFNLPAGVEIIDERTISALMCDMFLRPQPKLSIRVREIDPVTGIQSQREAPLLDENGDLRFHEDGSSVSGLIDLLDPSPAGVPVPNATGRSDLNPTRLPDQGPTHLSDPNSAARLDRTPADSVSDPLSASSSDSHSAAESQSTQVRGSTANADVSRPPSSGEAFFPGARPQPIPIEYSVTAEMPTTPEWMRNQAAVVTTVPLISLTGDSDLPGVLPDGSPIPAEVARRIAAGSPSLTRILTDPARGTPIDAQAMTYPIPKPVRKTLIAQWATCSVPGCRRPTEKSEIDHVDPFFHADPPSGGLTRFGNLHPLCKKCHSLKTARHYAVRMNDTGTATSAVEYEFPHGLMTTVTAPDQPIDVEQALEFYDLLGMKPCRWESPDHAVPVDWSIVEVSPTEELAHEHAEQRRREAETAARRQRLAEMSERSKEARNRRRLEQLLDWEHAEFPDARPPGAGTSAHRALPCGTRDPLAPLCEDPDSTDSPTWIAPMILAETEPPPCFERSRIAPRQLQIRHSLRDRLNLHMRRALEVRRTTDVRKAFRDYWEHDLVDDPPPF